MVQMRISDKKKFSMHNKFSGNQFVLQRFSLQFLHEVETNFK